MTRLRLPFVHEYRDRHGRMRRYVRRPGSRAVALPGMPGSDEFMGAYQAALAGMAPSARPPKEGTVAAVVASYYQSAEFRNLRGQSPKLYRRILDRLVQRDGHRLVRDLPPEKARKMIEELAARPAMANLTRAVLRRLLSHAIKRGIRSDNPFAGIPSYRIGTHHTWSDEEIEQFERRWPLGSRERLVMALLLYTAQRGGDVVRIRRGDIRDGIIQLVQEKTGTAVRVTIHPALAAAIEAGPTQGLTLLGDQHGRPIKRPALTKLVARAVEEAGLPDRCVAHGLRKAGLRRLAEHGATTKEIAAVSGHKTLKEIERYTNEADQERLARAAILRLPNKDGTSSG